MSPLVEESTGRAIRALDRTTGPVGRTLHGVVQTLPLGSMKIASDSFYGRWQERSGSVTIQHCIDNLESSGVLHNFRRIADGEDGPFVGMWFADSDLYKTLEAIGWESGRRGDLLHAPFVDMAISLIERAQDADGYINTYVQGDPSKGRWQNLVWSHELYCAGHLLQAGIALERGANDSRLAGIATRFVDRIVGDLGNRPEAYDGHAEIEMALIESYRQRGDRAHFEFAKSQLYRRGTGHLPKDPLGPEYFGDHATIDAVSEATGHAVRQLYYATAVVDAYLENGDSVMLAAAQRLWDSAFGSKTYITGGQGSRHHGEAFGDAWELPPDRAYAETCAGIASFHWNWRMLLATGASVHAAEMERVLHNTIAAASNLAGDRFFYTNPLQLRTGHQGFTDGSPAQRLSWFDCACCPPNLARLLASLAEFVATSTEGALQVHQLIAGRIETAITGVRAVVDIDSALPWHGDVSVGVEGAGEFEVAIRVPDWADTARVTIGGEDVPVLAGYARVRRDWSERRVISLSLPVRPRVIYAHPNIDAVRGCVALARGPFVYCIETVDHAPHQLEDLRMNLGAPVSEAEGVLPEVDVSLRVQGQVLNSTVELYGAERRNGATEEVELRAIPYFAWGNRGETAMRVWLPEID